jgi:hypothetical protein
VSVVDGIEVEIVEVISKRIILEMPFRSKAQIRACFAQQRANPNSSWDCRKWLSETKGYGKPGRRNLPNKIRKKTQTNGKNRKRIGGGGSLYERVLKPMPLLLF